LCVCIFQAKIVELSILHTTRPRAIPRFVGSPAPPLHTRHFGPAFLPPTPPNNMSEVPQSPQRAQQTKKLRSACDACHQCKVKCPGGTPCSRCLSKGLSCRYGFQNRAGKPKGSKNKKTLERQRQMNDAWMAQLSPGNGDETPSILEPEQPNFSPSCSTILDDAELEWYQVRCTKSQFNNGIDNVRTRRRSMRGLHRRHTLLRTSLHSTM
jgi:hypothetical protein